MSIYLSIYVYLSGDHAYKQNKTLALKDQMISPQPDLRVHDIKVMGYQWIQPVFCRAGEPANFLAAPAPDFFPKLLRLLVFFQAALAPRSQKHPAPQPRYFGLQLPGSGKPKIIWIINTGFPQNCPTQ